MRRLARRLFATHLAGRVRTATSWRRDVDGHLQHELGELPPEQQERYYKRATDEVLSGYAKGWGYVGWSALLWLVGLPAVVGLIEIGLALNRRVLDGSLSPWLVRAVLFIAGIAVLIRINAAIGVHYVRRHLWQLVPRICPTCGYDLRASPVRCPDCGTEVANG